MAAMNGAGLPGSHKPYNYGDGMGRFWTYADDWDPFKISAIIQEYWAGLHTYFARWLDRLSHQSTGYTNMDRSRYKDCGVEGFLSAAWVSLLDDAVDKEQ